MIVLDGVGVGELPDAADYGDEGSNTLGNVASAVGGLDLPNLEALGLGNVIALEGCPPQAGAPATAVACMSTRRARTPPQGTGKMMCLVFETGVAHVPARLPVHCHRGVRAQDRTGCHRQHAGLRTEIIQELGEEHQSSGKWIVYTSADSVFQIAAHVETIEPEELYSACQLASRDPDRAKRCRTCDRASIRGEPGSYTRTPERHDWSLEPKRPNWLSLVLEPASRSMASARSRTSSLARM